MSRFVGQVGKFLTTKVTVLKKIHRTTWKDKNELIRYLYVLSDRDGNILTISTPSGAFKPGEEWELCGRVKRYKEFKGTPQTHISRWSMTSKG